MGKAELFSSTAFLKLHLTLLTLLSTSTAGELLVPQLLLGLHLVLTTSGINAMAVSIRPVRSKSPAIVPTPSSRLYQNVPINNLAAHNTLEQLTPLTSVNVLSKMILFATSVSSLATILLHDPVTLQHWRPQTVLELVHPPPRRTQSHLMEFLLIFWPQLMLVLTSMLSHQKLTVLMASIRLLQTSKPITGTPLLRSVC